MSTIRILFVCMGNICRSPAGEGVLRHLLRAEGLEDSVEVDSAGTISEHTGHAPDPRMVAAARRRGIPLVGSARQVNARDLERFDLILAMDRDNLNYLRRLDRSGAHERKIQLFRPRYCGGEGHPAQFNDEIPDPYYGGARGFEEVLDLLEAGCRQLLASLRSEIGC